MKLHSQIRVTMVPQLRRKARPTIPRQPVTSTLLTKNNGRRPILSQGTRDTGHGTRERQAEGERTERETWSRHEHGAHQNLHNCC